MNGSVRTWVSEKRFYGGTRVLLASIHATRRSPKESFYSLLSRHSQDHGPRFLFLYVISCLGFTWNRLGPFNRMISPMASRRTLDERTLVSICGALEQSLHVKKASPTRELPRLFSFSFLHIVPTILHLHLHLDNTSHIFCILFSMTQLAALAPIAACLLASISQAFPDSISSAFLASSITSSVNLTQTLVIAPSPPPPPKGSCKYHPGGGKCPENAPCCMNGYCSGTNCFYFACTSDEYSQLTSFAFWIVDNPRFCSTGCEPQNSWKDTSCFPMAFCTNIREVGGSKMHLCDSAQGIKIKGPRQPNISSPIY